MTKYRVFAPALVAILCLIGVACSGAGAQTDGSQSASPSPGAGGSDPVIAAVGDIACHSFPKDHNRRCRYNQVAKDIQGIHPDRFLALGDMQYLHGSYEDYQTY